MKVVKIFTRVLEILFRKIAFLVFKLKGHYPKSGRKKVLTIAHHSNYSRFYSVEGRRYVGDFYYRGIEELLRSDKDLILSVLSPATPRMKKFSAPSDFLEIAKGRSYVPIEAYVKTRFYIKNFFKKIFLYKKFKEAINNPEFTDSFNYKGINLYSVLSGQLKRLFVGSFSSGIFLLDLAENILTKQKPDIILTIYETSTDRMALEMMASKRNIPVLGFQHGAISSFTAARFSYCHRDSEVWYSESEEPLSCPIANKTLVYGEYYKDILINSGYPANTLVATGCPRFDRLFNLDRSKAVDNCQKLGINADGKNILFLTEGLDEEFMLQEIIPDQEKNIRSAETILKSSPKDSTLIIKVHPRDRAGNYEYLFKKFSGREIKVVENIDLADLIQCSSLVLMKASTAGLEAAIFKNPVVSLNLFNEPDFADYYVKEGVALVVNDADSLKEALQELLNDTPARQRLISNMDGFIKKYLFSSDAKSSERVKEALLKEIC